MIDGKRMQESEGTKFRIKNEANQKSSEKQIWVENKSGGGGTVRKVKHSSVRIENPIPALYSGTEYFSLARTFRTALGSKNNSGQKKTNEADPFGAASFDLCSSC